MKIIVCIKQVPDSDDVKINPETGTLIRSSVPAVLNPSDKHALSMAAELVKNQPDAEVTVLTMGPPAAENALREGLAYGFTDGILLCDRDFAGADTLATSKTLAAAIQKTGMPDLILTGYRSTDGETGHVGPQIAEHLGIPQITKVKELTIDETEKRLYAVRNRDEAEEKIEAKLPVLCTIDDTETETVYLKVSQIFDAWEKPIVTYTRADLELEKEETGLAGSKTKVTETFLPKEVQRGEIFTGNKEEAAEALFEKLQKERVLG